MPAIIKTMPIKPGTLVQDIDHGVCTVLSYRKTGHQYERYYEYDVLTPIGKIITTDEYEFLSDKIKVIQEIEND